MNAQATFTKIYSGITAFKFNLTETPDHDILVGLGRTRAVSRVDLVNGNITFTHSYWAHPTELLTGLGGIHCYTENAYVFAAGCKMTLDTCEEESPPSAYYDPVIGKIDGQGNLLDLRRYSLGYGCRNIGSDALVLADRGIVVWGHEQSFFALKADSALDPLWAIRLTNHGGFRFIKELPGGDLLAGFDMDTAGACVARLDGSGNFIWCKSYIRPFGRMHDAVIGPDSSFTITGYTGNAPQRLFMMKLGAGGEVQWCHGYDNGSAAWASLFPSRIVPTQDGKLAILGTLGQTQFPYFYRPLLMKTDLDGDTLWTRSMGADGYVYYTQDLMAHSDGGYAISGGIWGNLPEGQSGLPCILKTDSLGHFSCAERTQAIEVVELFPVDSSFTLTSIDGATAYPAFLNDTVFDPIHVYDACGSNTTNAALSSRSSKMRLHPNPNSGHFTMAFKDPRMADSWYSVYDATGKLLYQRPLPAGKGTEEVDLSRYGKGTYVIKCTDKDGVYHERVVVE